MKLLMIALLVISVLIGLHLISPPEIVPTADSRLQIAAPAFVLQDIAFEISVTAKTPAGEIDRACQSPLIVHNLGQASRADSAENLKVNLENGRVVIKNLAMKQTGAQTIRVGFEGRQIFQSIRVLPGFLSLMPPFLAIILALVARQVVIALFAGIWVGATMITNYDPVTGFLRVVDTYLIQALSQPDHVAIVMFSMTLGGMVGVISRAGGAEGIVEKLTPFANNRRGGLLATWALGIFIFFDDYANILIVGNTMRPFTDKLRISHEKLAYIVDSTAAPVASLFPISTWVGFQVALIAGVFEQLKIDQDAYLVFLESIPYASYSIFAVLFVGITALMLRDFGPMLRSERRAISTGQLIRDGATPLADSVKFEILEKNIPRRWYNALVPILTVIFVTLFGLYVSGSKALGGAANAGLREIVSHANSFHVLMWASVSGALVAIIMAVTQKILTLSKAIDAWLDGVKSMVLAMIILVLAWSIGKVCEDLMAAQFVMHLTESVLSPRFLPVLTFLMAAVISFATGTSWATMAILIPIVIPITHQLIQAAALPPGLSQSILLGTIGAILSGSIFGDHGSPISDTTIMSSMASGSDHIDHVRTQLPYAFFIGAVSIVTGYLPAGFGINIYGTMAFGVVILFLGLYFIGKPILVLKK
jgi:Na+/H+ antiporter NhaC